jgi:hypothetical protein
MTILEEEYNIMRIMSENHGIIYYEMFGALIYEGMDINTAIWHCWNNLECGGVNG